jgi:hypothetical protein
VNALGYLRVVFAVDDIDETLERLRKRGTELVGEVSRTKTRIGSATSAALKGFSLDLPRTLPAFMSWSSPKLATFDPGKYNSADFPRVSCPNS